MTKIKPKVWVYDIVINKNEEIVALCYHTEIIGSSKLHGNCLLLDKAKLANDEDLKLDCSPAFPTLADARAAAWNRKGQFAKDLD